MCAMPRQGRWHPCHLAPWNTHLAFHHEQPHNDDDMTGGVSVFTKVVLLHTC